MRCSRMLLPEKNLRFFSFPPPEGGLLYFLYLLHTLFHNSRLPPRGSWIFMTLGSLREGAGFFADSVCETDRGSLRKQKVSANSSLIDALSHISSRQKTIILPIFSEDTLYKSSYLLHTLFHGISVYHIKR